MRGFWLGLSLSVAFVLGCVSAPLVVPPLSAQNEAAGAHRWEYMCFEAAQADSVEPRANGAGMQGWELAAAGARSEGGALVWCFKRAL